MVAGRAFHSLLEGSQSLELQSPFCFGGCLDPWGAVAALGPKKYLTDPGYLQGERSRGRSDGSRNVFYLFRRQTNVIRASKSP